MKTPTERTLLRKVRYYDKLARRVRRKAERAWFAGYGNLGTYESELEVASGYENASRKLLSYVQKWY